MAKKIKSSISAKQLRELRESLHHLKPIVIIGNNGLTENVLAEINHALNDHELIKIRINAENSSDRTEVAQKICAQTSAILVQTIGHILAIYRKNPLLEERKSIL
jgi:RNA-binding protein